ncbi:MAG: 5'-methylthioadenosine/adenosylhomocysteine nucleosidase [Lachnospiraceae bacterium]|nr:5'-methylthioadenosine/adenosylhomocysteine nucleosidase [Lachnospiraceae bacterium]
MAGRLGIICAMEVELEKILSMMETEQTESISGLTFHCGRIGKREAVCVVCGVGKVFAGLCAQTMILKYAPECILNVGVAGSLSTELHIADIVIATDLVQHDMDCTPLGLPRGKILETDRLEFPTDPGVAEQLQEAVEALNRERTERGEAPVGILRGRIASGDQFIASAEQKDFIIKEFAAVACEMEGAAIAQVCCVNRMPFVVMRAISDAADQSSHMDYPEFTKLAAANTAAVVGKFCAL